MTEINNNNAQSLSPSQATCTPSLVCCEVFINTLNEMCLGEPIDKSDDSSSVSSSNEAPIQTMTSIPAKEKLFSISDTTLTEIFLTPDDVLSFLAYCQIWQIK